MLHVIDVYQTDKSIVVAVEESDTLADLKKRITSRHVDSPAPSAQRLVAGGKELSDLGVSVRVALGVSWCPHTPGHGGACDCGSWFSAERHSRRAALPIPPPQLAVPCVCEIAIGLTNESASVVSVCLPSRAVDRRRGANAVAQRVPPYTGERVRLAPPPPGVGLPGGVTAPGR